MTIIGSPTRFDREPKKTALALEEASKEVTVIFNNNSGGHAAANGKSLKNLLGLAFEELGPQQIDLF